VPPNSKNQQGRRVEMLKRPKCLSPENKVRLYSRKLENVLYLSKTLLSILRIPENVQKTSRLPFFVMVHY
jgi:hypothetical protein